MSSDATPIYLSTTQINAMRGLFAGSAMVSIAGSSVIAYRLLRGNKLSKRPFERLVMGLSISDLIMSFQNVIFPIFFYPFTEPSIACSADGFMSSLSYMGPYYNCSLSFYYLLVLVYGVKDDRLQKVYEPIMHCVSVCLPALSAIVGASLQVYNPIEFSISCWSNTYPTGCGDEGEECIRSDPWTTFIYGILVGALPVGVVLLSLLVNSVIIFCSIRKVENQARRYRLKSRSMRDLHGDASSGPASREGTTATQAESSSIVVRAMVAARQARQKMSTKQSLQVAHQSFSWVMAFFLAFISITALFLASVADPESFKTQKYTWLQMMNALLYPLQGLFNVLVYIRPRYLRWRRQSELGRGTCFYKALFTFEAPPRKKSSPAPDSHMPVGTSDAAIVQSEMPLADDQMIGDSSWQGM